MVESITQETVFQQTYDILSASDYQIIDIQEQRKTILSRVTYRTGKTLKQIKSFIQKPEVKACTLVASWALSATILLLVMISAPSAIAFFAALSLFVIETYAVFGNVEYTVAFAMAKRMMDNK